MAVCLLCGRLMTIFYIKSAQVRYMDTLQKCCVCVLYTEFVSGENSLAQNVSEGQTAEFTCVTTNSHVIITWITTPNVGLVTPIKAINPVEENVQF